MSAAKDLFWAAVSILFIVVVIGFIAWLFISSEQEDQRERGKIRECVEAGGNPIYSTDRSGVVELIICELP